MIDIATYRARLGTFCMPRKVKRKMRTICVKKGTLSVILRLAVVLSMLVTLGGDVELNPGPPRAAKQRTLTFGDDDTPIIDSASPSLSSSQSNRTRAGKATRDSEVMCFLREMKAEMKTDLTSINSKITNMNESLNTLREENDMLKRENREIREEIGSLNVKLDKLGGHSRRNNLRFFGLRGRVTETWEESEKTVRKFISDTLGMTNSENIGIERAHRVGSRQSDKCAIIAKFSSFKDKDEILKKARGTLGRNSEYTVREDYTDRVLTHRRELGKKLVEARENGQYASLKYDKLIIDGSVYRYNDRSDQIVLIGAARGRQNRFGSNQADNRERQRGNPLASQVNSNLGTDGSRDHGLDDADESLFEGDEERGAIGGRR